jgi:dTDP-4-dehydrorhamnose reductase
MRVLVLGGMGMLGHAVASRLAAEHEVSATIRSALSTWPSRLTVAAVLPDTDLTGPGTLETVFARTRPELVVNCAGLVKQRLQPDSDATAILVNAVLPHRLAVLCRHAGVRLIHISTDCVFSGAAGGNRGADGYRERDFPDATDLYGRSKLLGEIDGPGCITLRLSLIGRELQGQRGLVEWFLANARSPLTGFTEARFTGLSTVTAAGMIADLARDHPRLEGLWHVAAEPLSKYELLCRLRDAYGLDTRIDPAAEPYCDRRLDGGRFRQATGWVAPSWSRMIEEIVAQGGR